MHGKKANSLIVIEKGVLTTYQLDSKAVWEVGRPSRGNIPDIRMSSATVSRKHGKFQNMDGIWFYLDYNGKNGTVYNKKHIAPGLKGRVKPVMLSDKDILIFGGGEEAVINCKTVWAMYLDRELEEPWRVADVKGMETIRFDDGSGAMELYHPDKGIVIEKKDGIAIYMGDLVYMSGCMEIVDV